MPARDFDQYRSLIARSFIDTHDPYDDATVTWPDLDADTHAWLGNLPIWTEAVQAEQDMAVIVDAMAQAERDPLFKEAIALQAYEEARHARLVRSMTEHYGFPVERHESVVPTRPVWSFLVSGWGECLDSFFAFGLFKVAERLSFLPRELVGLFDLVMREEARHIVFFENWTRYRALTRSVSDSTLLRALNASAALMHVGNRAIAGIQLARQDSAGTNFILSGAAHTLPGLTVRGFLDTCLDANEERLSGFDLRLARPQIVSRLVRLVRPRWHSPSHAMANGRRPTANCLDPSIGQPG
jgi:hypothetical protein